MLIKVKRYYCYASAWSFITKFYTSEKAYNKCMEIWGRDLEEIKKNKCNKKEKVLAITEHLNSLGWSDEDIITKMLEYTKGNFFVDYIDDGDGYFKIYSLKGSE